MKIIIIIIIKIEKENFVQEKKIWNGLLPILYCGIVLQGGLKGKKIVLQYSFCIAEKEAWRVGFVLQYT